MQNHKTLSEYLYDLLVGIDQLGNAFAGGNVDCTVSGRTYALYHETVKWYWAALMWVIDFAFEPIDDKEHCKQAYESEPDELYYKAHGWVIWIEAILIIPLCLLLIRPVTWCISKLK